MKREEHTDVGKRRALGLGYGLVGLLVGYALVAIPLAMAGRLWAAAITTTAAVAAALWLVHYVGRRPTDVTNSKITITATGTPTTFCAGKRDRPQRMAPAHLDAFFRHHSRSFSFSARWFSKEDRRIVSYLYAFCRLTDDIADNTDDVSASQRAAALSTWHRLASDSFEGTASGIAWLDELMRESKRRDVPFQLVDDLIAGVRSDLQPRHVEDVAELDDYCYHVASVVGIWLCHLQGVRDPAQIQYAATLGRAMQMTNILRDVGEDFARGRIYLPRQLMRQFGVCRDDLESLALGQSPTKNYRALIDHMMRVADEQYRLGWVGISNLPRRFGRTAAVAACVYQEIHAEIRRNGFNNFKHRAHTGPLRKVVVAGIALWRRTHPSSLKASPLTSASPGRPDYAHPAFVGPEHQIAIRPVRNGPMMKSVEDP